MHKSRLGCLVIDCQTEDLDREASFWSGALGYSARRSENPEDENYRTLKALPNEVQMLLQRVDHPSRVHLDIETDDIEAEVARLEKLGAKTVARIRTWCVMEAPSGHRFCVVNPQSEDFAEKATEWP